MDEFAQPPSFADDNFFREDENNRRELKPAPLVDSSNTPTSPELFQAKVEPEMKKTKSVDKENKSEADKVKVLGKEKSISDERKMNTESISDFSDPLHSYMNLDDEVFKEPNNGQLLAVSELPQSNIFRKALDDTILSVSPFLKVNWFDFQERYIFLCFVNLC